VDNGSSPSRVAGVCIRHAALGAQKFCLSQPDKVRRVADEEALIVSRRLDMLVPMTEACAKLDAAQGDRVLSLFIDRLMCGIASQSEWVAYFQSRWRLAFRFWNALDPEHKLDPADPLRQRPLSMIKGVHWAFELICSAEVTEEQREALEVAIEQVSQETEIPKSAGCAA
jgi:hypothetical protein